MIAYLAGAALGIALTLAWQVATGLVRYRRSVIDGHERAVRLATKRIEELHATIRQDKALIAAQQTRILSLERERNELMKGSP